MTVSTSDTLAHLRKRRDQQARASRVRADELRTLLPALAATLRERHGAERVWLFGSLATGDGTPESDVDLAVDRLETGTYFSALGMLMEGLGCGVDLVPLDRASPSLVERVLATGREL